MKRFNVLTLTVIGFIKVGLAFPTLQPHQRPMSWEHQICGLCLCPLEAESTLRTELGPYLPPNPEKSPAQRNGMVQALFDCQFNSPSAALWVWTWGLLCSLEELCVQCPHDEPVEACGSPSL